MLDLCLLLRETPGAVNSTQVLVNLRKSNLRIGPVKLEAEVWRVLANRNINRGAICGKERSVNSAYPGVTLDCGRELIAPKFLIC